VAAIEDRLASLEQAILGLASDMKKMEKNIDGLIEAVKELQGKGKVEAPNPALPPNFGSVKLKVGFVPDPFVKELLAGGKIKTELGGVTAHVSKAPDFRLNYEKGALQRGVARRGGP
jgi:hypothetical protein